MPSARAAALMGILLSTLALVVWFGVKLGLRPLTDLQEAISIRSPDDLSQIKRAVPVETEGIVQTLNRLFGQVERSMDAHQTFISDAAHQLRNPAAAVQSMAEAVKDATTSQQRDKRLDELVNAARSSNRIAEQLLSLDRLQHPLQETSMQPVAFNRLVETTCADLAPSVMARGIDFSLDLCEREIQVCGDPVFLAEAVKNLVDNAIQHGGGTLSEINVSLACFGALAELTVADNGKGLSPDESAVAFGRFSQVEPSKGSGLGLAIVQSIAERHDGTLRINPVESGASLTVSLPGF